MGFLVHLVRLIFGIVRIVLARRHGFTLEFIHDSQPFN